MRWKYTSIELGLYEDPNEQLDAAGAQGWELVSALTFSGIEHDAKGYAYVVNRVRYILKAVVPGAGGKTVAGAGSSLL